MRIHSVIAGRSDPLVPHLPLQAHRAVGVAELIPALYALLLGGDEHFAQVDGYLELYLGSVELGIAYVAQIFPCVYEIVRDVTLRQTVFEIDEPRLFPIGKIAVFGDRIGSGRDLDAYGRGRKARGRRRFGAAYGSLPRGIGGPRRVNGARRIGRACRVEGVHGLGRQRGGGAGLFFTARGKQQKGCERSRCDRHYRAG